MLHGSTPYRKRNPPVRSTQIVRQISAVLLAMAVFCPALPADEGMWTFDNPPTKLLQQKYNFTPNQQW